VYYLGRANAGWFHLFTNVPIETPYDMAGLKMRVSGTYEAFAKALGASVVTVPYGEVYTALERGTVDGFGWKVVGPADAGWPEVCKYIIEPKIYWDNTEFIVNLDKWNSLPKHLQDLLTNSAIANEKEFYDIIVNETCPNETQRIAGHGDGVDKFSPADTEWYVNLAYSAAWEEVLEASPELGPRFRDLLSK